MSRHLFTKLGLNCFGGRACNNSRTAYAPSALGVLTTHKMAASGVLAFYLAAGGNLYSLAQPLMGLLFRHLANPFKKTLCDPASKSGSIGLRFGARKFKTCLLPHLPPSVKTAGADSPKNLSMLVQ